MLRSKSPEAGKNGELLFIVSAISQVPRVGIAEAILNCRPRAKPLIQTGFRFSYCEPVSEIRTAGLGERLFPDGR
jgi:hypothetical protein